MTEELLSEAVAKMNGACKGKMQLRYTGSDTEGQEWWLYRHTDVCPSAYATKRYSPILTLCQLVDWCEAWLQGANEIIAITVFDKQKCHLAHPRTRTGQRGE